MTDKGILEVDYIIIDKSKFALLFLLRYETFKP